MKSFIRIAPLALLLVLGTALSAQQAMASMDKSKHEFGDVPQNVPVSYEFTVTNSGDAPLILLDVSKPCGCQKADFTKKAIQPGKTGTVTATFNAKKAGHFSKTFTLRHNGEGSETVLVLSGTVKPSLDTDPALSGTPNPN